MPAVWPDGGGAPRRPPRPMLLNRAPAALKSPGIRSSRSAFSVTSTVAPVSARMAGQRPVMPRMVVTRNTAFSPSAMVMFWRMLAIVRRDRSTMAATSVTRPCSTAASAVSSATSVPPPMAMPTSAAASAGASLMPSPTLATILPARLSSSTMRCLSSGSSSARASMPSVRRSRWRCAGCRRSA